MTVLTDEQVDRLANRLFRTQRTVEQGLKAAFPKTHGGPTRAEPGIEDRLRAIGEVFRCENCSTWTATDMESRCKGYCIDCDPDTDAVE